MDKEHTTPSTTNAMAGSLDLQDIKPKQHFFHPDNIDNFQSPGTYFQNFGACIHIGYGTYIAPNVGLITANHKLHLPDEHEEGRDIHIGDRCWIGMNAVILPGVTLGPGTIVAAGAVVTKSYTKGNVVLGGVPARIVKEVPEPNRTDDSNIHQGTA